LSDEEPPDEEPPDEEPPDEEPPDEEPPDEDPASGLSVELVQATAVTAATKRAIGTKAKSSRLR
jgi:hypothetical protein